MPDSLPPPSWGIPPYDEWDLDVLLSGEVTDIPVALRPLADALTALKGPPTLAELRGEATIMADFRAQAKSSVPSRSAHPRERAETLELLALQSGSRPRRGARHRVRRPANRRFGAFLMAAAAAVIVGAAAFTGNLPGPHLLSTSSRAASSATRPTSPNLQDRSASSVPAGPQQGKRSSPSPSPSAGVSTNGGALCRTFFSSFEHAANGQQWWKLPDYGQLSAEAGGPSHILGFCKPYLKTIFPHGLPKDLPGSLGTSQSGQGNQGVSSSGQDSNGGSSVHYPAKGAS